MTETGNLRSVAEYFKMLISRKHGDVSEKHTTKNVTN